MGHFSTRMATLCTFWSAEGGKPHGAKKSGGGESINGTRSFEGCRFATMHDINLYVFRTNLLCKKNACCSNLGVTPTITVIFAIFTIKLLFAKYYESDFKMKCGLAYLFQQRHFYFLSCYLNMLIPDVTSVKTITVSWSQFAGVIL